MMNNTPAIPAASDAGGFYDSLAAEYRIDVEVEGLTDPDEIPEPPDEAITQPGDLWLLGAHTTCPHCGEVNEL